MSSTDASTELTSEQIQEIEKAIKTKGDEIRKLKEDGIEKSDLAPHIAELIALKSKIASPEEQKPKKKKKAKAPQQQQKKKKQPPKKESDMSESELRANRLQKAQLMREAGEEPYAYTYDPTHKAAELVSL
jgi:hypothetical protein